MFNVTNAATFEDIIFQGNDNYAFYRDSPNSNMPISEFPMKLCEPAATDTSNHDFTITKVGYIPFTYDCLQPSHLSD